MDDIEVPYRMRHLPVYKGYIVHHTVYVDANGVPDFKVIHEANRRDCANRRLCNLCGWRLGKHIVFIGGPLSVQARTFTDGPMHEKCALYATKVCPYLNNAHYSETQRSPRSERDEGMKTVTFEESLPGRPAQMAMYYTTEYFQVWHDGHMHFKACNPTKIVWDAMPERRNP